MVRIGWSMKVSSDQDRNKVLGSYFIKMGINIKDSLEMIWYGVKEECLIEVGMLHRLEFGKEESLYHLCNE